MKEVLIKYNDPKVLKILKDIAKYFDFEVANSKKSSEKKCKVNGVTIIEGDASVDISELEDIFSKKNIDAKELRRKAWQRGK